MYSGLSFENNENDFLHGSGSETSSNLADLFDADDFDGKQSNDSNSSLKYIPPKKKSLDNAKKLAEQATWSVVVSKIVTAYKLIDDNNVQQGLLGIALLTHSQIHSSKLILYKQKNQLLSTLVLKESSQVFWKSPFIQYYDDLGVFWSLSSKEEDFDELCENLTGKCEIVRTSCDEQSQTKSEVQGENSEEKASIQMSSTEAEEGDNSNSNDSETRHKSDVMSRVAKVGLRMPMANPVGGKDSIDSQTLKTAPKKIETENVKESNQMPNNPMQSNSVPSDSSEFIALTAEYRLQNTELRINLSKLDSKLDRVIDNIELLRLDANAKPRDSNELEEENLQLEERMLELKKENRCLKLQLQEVNLSRQQKLEQVSKHNSLMETLRTENHEKGIQIDELLAQVEHLTISLQNDIDTARSNEDKITALQKELGVKSTEIDRLQQQITEASNKSSEMVRSILNEFYQKLHASICDETDVSSADVLKLSADIIRKETKAAFTSK